MGPVEIKKRLTGAPYTVMVTGEPNFLAQEQFPACAKYARTQHLRLVNGGEFSESNCESPDRKIATKVMSW